VFHNNEPGAGAFLDVFTCGPLPDPAVAGAVLTRHFGGRAVLRALVERGTL
jgi:S-adenosylmethionine/arginine decarboxylase-like enzyme